MDNSLLEKLWENFHKAKISTYVEMFALWEEKAERDSIKPFAFQCYVAGYLAGKEDSDEN